ncbi:MAG: WYL domain-containing protein, partial [Candidatus Methanomethylophilus sp.]|nr:WYL domain-containing protein [Methanomethylophilus sp.]
EYLEDPSFIPEEWFRDMVGVTKFRNDRPERVVIQASPSEAPYIRTKPLHPSQRILEVRDDGSAVFELKVIVNRELVRLLFGYAEGIRVLRPRKLVYMMRRHFQLGSELYTEKDD